MDNQTGKIFNKDYQTRLKDVVQSIIMYDDVPKAVELSSILSKALVENASAFVSFPAELSFYKKIITQLKFLGLPLVDDKEVISLIKDSFSGQFEIPDYDLLKKISGKLLNIILIKDRNSFKTALKNALSENNEKIVDNYNLKTIKDWIKDYITKVGLDQKDNLVKAQYLVKLRDAKTISPAQINKLVLLFNFYDLLNAPSDTPEGFEEEPPIMINGKLYIFRKGTLELVGENEEVSSALEFMGSDTSETPLESRSTGASLDTDATLTHTAELEEMLKSFSPGSFEYKAISQEILRLKKVEARKNEIKK